MKYEIYYLNGAGKKLDFTQIPYLMETGDLLDFEWQYNSTTNHNSFGGKISDFTTGALPSRRGYWQSECPQLRCPAWTTLPLSSFRHCWNWLRW